MDESHDLLVRIDERTKHTLEKIDEQNKRLDSHSRKIRNLELWRNWITGGGAAIAALLGIKHI